MYQRQIDLLLCSSLLVFAAIALNTLYTSFQLHFLYPLILLLVVAIPHQLSPSDLCFVTHFRKHEGSRNR